MEINKAQEAANKGMEQSERHADNDFKNAVVDVIRTLALRQEEVCSDDVNIAMKYMYPTVSTHDKHVIGPMFKRAQKMGYIQPYICDHCGSMVTRKSKNVVSHADPMHIWRSCIWQKEAIPETVVKSI